jgi:hypothetical protein
MQSKFIKTNSVYSNIPKKLFHNILKVCNGEKVPPTPQTGKAYYIADGVTVGDMVETEYGVYVILQHIRGAKFKGRRTQGNQEAYFFVRDYSQNALVFCNAQIEVE